MYQLRNVFFSMINQSKFSTELDKVIKKADKIQDYTVKLNEEDKKIDMKMDECVKVINNNAQLYKTEQIGIQKNNDKRMALQGNDLKNA